MRRHDGEQVVSLKEVMCMRVHSYSRHVYYEVGDLFFPSDHLHAIHIASRGPQSKQSLC